MYMTEAPRVLQFSAFIYFCYKPLYTSAEREAWSQGFLGQRRASLAKSPESDPRTHAIDRARLGLRQALPLTLQLIHTVTRKSIPCVTRGNGDLNRSHE